MEKIKSITEAFAHQPVSLEVDKRMFGSDKIIASIELEIITHRINGDPFDYRYYVGRDAEGNKLFEYRAETVNVHYY